MQVQRTGSSYTTFGSKKTEKTLKNTSKALQKILERLSEGKRINNASDDAAGLAIAEQLTGQVRGFKMASRNIEDAVSALNIAEGSGETVSSLLQRQRELALAARNDTLSDTDRSALDKEFQALSQEIDRVANVSNFNRQNVADGTELASGNAQIQVGSNETDQIEIPGVNFTVESLGLTGLSISNSADSGSALSAIDSAINAVSSQRSTVGTTINKLGSSADNLAVAMINTQAAESVIRDQDMASGMAELVRAQLLNEGATGAFSRFNQISQNHIMGLLQ